MAHITFTYKCGHKGETWEPGRKRGYVQSKAAGETCWECRKNTQNAEAVGQAAEAGLSPLTGKSEKQVAFGETCRAWMLPIISEMYMPEAERGNILKWLAEKVDAAWWCDLRHYPRGETLMARVPDIGEHLSREYHQDTGRRAIFVYEPY